MTAPLVAAFYLPQFHPIPENDLWWGPGFTEWINVAGARPRFRGHRQPNLPGELGFYDLRCQETRVDQAALAEAHGIGAFAYWHYWFDGRLLLDLPARRVLESGQPSFPFFFAWANHSWSTNTWTAVRSKTAGLLLEQTYPGPEDHRRHFHHLLPYFSDPRYLRVEDRPLFYIRQPLEIPNLEEFIELWRNLASENGLADLWLVGEAWENDAGPAGMDRVARFHRPASLPTRNGPIERLRRSLRGRPVIREWADLERRALDLFDDEWPVLLANWDTTPRRGRSGTVLRGTSPEAFERLLRQAVRRARGLDSPQIMFIKSWNEWAEGNYLEPDRHWHRGWLQAVANAVGGTDER